MHRHFAIPAWLRRAGKTIAVAVAAILALAGIAAYAADSAPPPATTAVQCGAGDLLVHPGGTWNCATPLPSPSSLTESPLPTGSASPSTSPSPSPSTSTTTPTTSPSPTPTGSASSSNGPCPVAGKNVPGGADPWGGCWPGPGNTGVPAGVTLSAYTGPCTITKAGTVIDSKHVTCSTLSIQASGVVLRNSWFDGTDIDDGDSGSASFTIVDSKVSNGARDQCACVGYHDFTATRVEVIGGNRSMYCVARCVITDSWMHGQQLLGAQHGSALREEQYTTAVHNALTCDYLYDPSYDERSCSASLTGYPDFAPIHNNTIKRNLFVDGHLTAFCAYGGATAGKPYSSASNNATYQVFVENVFQRGQKGASGTGPHCGDYGAVTDFALGRTGNVFSGTWDDGTPLTSADL